MNAEFSVDQQSIIHENLEMISNYVTENPHRVNDSDWNYLDSGNDWYGVCSQGSMQSPIMIENSNTVKVAVVGSPYYPFSYEYPLLTNQGLFIEKGFQCLYCEGKVNFYAPNGHTKVFETQKIEIHAPAEHIIKGKQRALELHITHKERITGNILIFAVLFKISAVHNEFIQNLIDGETADVSELIGEKPEIYTYLGSLTSPPCSETILWVISTSTQKLSYEQVKFFSSKWENNQAFARGLGNNRSIQPLNSRVVFIF